jgi:ketosteroid isomerase-like protein
MEGTAAHLSRRAHIRPIVAAMDNPEANVRLARAWLSAFNAKDVVSLIALYAEHATHTSPKIRALHPETGGKLRGKDSIAEWWRGAIARTPGLRYEEVAVTASADRVLLEYVRHADADAPLPVAEAFDVERGRIVASRVYHG